MSDTEKTVSVDFSITGVDTNTLTELSNSFESLGSVISSVVGNIETLNTSLSKVSVPKNLTKVIQTLSDFTAPDLSSLKEGLEGISSINVPTELSSFISQIKQLNNLKSTGITGIVTALNSLSGVETPQNLSTLISELTTLSGISVSTNFDSLITQLKSLSKLKVTGITKIIENLSQLSSIKTPVTLESFVKTLLELSGISIPKDLSTLVTTLEGFSSIKTSNLESFTKGLKEITAMSTELSSLGTNLKTIKDALSQFSSIKIPSLSSFAKGLTQLSESSYNLEKVQTILKGIASALEAFDGTGIPNISNLVTGLKKLIALDLDSVEKKLKELNILFTELGKSKSFSGFSTFASNLNTISKQAETASASVKEFTTQTETSSSAMKQFGTAMTKYLRYRVIATSVVYLQQTMISAVNSIVDFDQSLKDLQAITDSTDRQVSNMSDTILDVASSTKFSAEEVAQGMRTIEQAGFTAAESIETIQSVSDLATGTLSSMSSVVDLVTTAIRSFNLESTDSTKVADVFANAVNGSKLTIDKLRTSMNYIGPIASDVGASLEDTAAAMMILANSGLQASTIGTGLRRVLAVLASPTKAFKKAVDAAGLSMDDFNVQSLGLQTVIQNLHSVITDTGTAFDIFGKRGAAAALALSENATEFSAMSDKVSTSGTAAKQAEKQLEGLGTMIKNLSDRFGVLAITIGDLGITDIMRVIVSATQTAVTALTTLAQNGFVKTIAKVTLFTVSITSLIAVLKVLSGSVLPVLINNIASFISKLTGLNKATEAATSIKVLSTALEGVAAANAATGISALSAALSNLKSVLSAAFAPALATLSKFAPEITLVVTALAALSRQYQDTASDASDAAMNMSDSLDTVSAKITSYQEKTIGMDENSSALKDSTASLRKEMVSLVDDMSPLSTQAQKIINAIDSMGTSFNGSNETLQEFKKTAQNLSMDKAIESFDLLGDSIEKQTDGLHSFIRSAEDSWESFSTRITSLTGSFLDLLNGDVSSALNDLIKGFDDIQNASVSLEGKQVFEDLRNGAEDAYTSLKKLVSTFDTTNLAPWQEDLTAIYKKLNEGSSELLNKMLAIGDVNLDMTVDSFTKVVEKLNLGEIETQALIDKFNDLKTAANSVSDNIVEIWSKQENPTYLTDSIEEYEKLGGELTDVQELELKRFEDAKAHIVEEMSLLDSDAQKQKEVGNTSYEYWKSYWEKKKALIEDANTLQEEMDNSSATNQIETFDKVYDEYKTSMERINILYADSASERVKYSEEAYQKLIKQLQDLSNNTTAVSPKVEKSQYKSDIQELKEDYAKYINDLAVLDAQGAITHEQYEAEKSQATQNAYEDEWKRAQEYYNNVKNSGDTKVITNALSEQTKAAESYYSNKAKLLASYNVKVASYNTKETKNAKKTAEEILKYSEKTSDEREKLESKLVSAKTKYDDKVETAAQKLANKRESIEKSLSLSIQKINKKLATKLSEISQKMEKTDEKYAQKALSIQTEAEDKIQEVRQKGMTENEKELDNQNTAYKKLQKGIEQVAKAKSTGDEASLQSGQQLISQAEDLYSNLTDQEKATKGIKSAEEALLQANDVEKQIEKLKEEKEAKDAIVDATEKIQEAEKKAANDTSTATASYDLKISNLEKAYNEEVNKDKKASDKRIEQEKLRHKKKMLNLEEEYKELEKMLDLYTQMQKSTTGNSSSSSSSSSTASTTASTTSSTQAETKRHNLVQRNLNDEIKKIQERGTIYTDTVEEASDSEGDLKDTVKDSYKSAEEYAKELSDADLEVVKENGQTIIQYTQDYQDELYDGIIDGAEDAGNDVGDSFTDGLDDAGTKTEQSMQKLVAKIQDDGSIVLEYEAPENSDEVEEEVQDETEDMDATVGVDVEVSDPDAAAEEVEDEVPDDTTVTAQVQAIGTSSINTLKTAINQLKDKVISITANVSGQKRIENLKNTIDSIQSKTVTITVNYVTNGSSTGDSSVSAATGGLIPKIHGRGYDTGGKAFTRLASPYINNGSGIKDDVPAMLMQGEFVMKKSAVAKYGKKFMYMLNNGVMPKIPGYKDGGVVDLLGDKMSSFIRSAQLIGDPSIPFSSGGVVMNINSPSFNNYLSGALGGFTDITKQKLMLELLKSFNDTALGFIKGNFNDSPFGQFKNKMLNDLSSSEISFEQLKTRDFVNNLSITAEQLKSDMLLRDNIGKGPGSYWEISKNRLEAEEGFKEEQRRINKDRSDLRKETHGKLMDLLFSDSLEDNQAQLQDTISQLPVNDSGEGGESGEGTQYFAKGGWVGYPRGKKKKEDSVDAKLTPGEFVVNEGAVKKYGVNFLEKINQEAVNNSRAIGLKSKAGNLAKGMTTELGIKSAANLTKTFSDAVSHFDEGGDVSDAEALMSEEISNVQALYNVYIAEAKDSGEEELAYILEKEEYDLEVLAYEYKTELQELEDDYNDTLEDLEEDYNDDVADAEDDYNDNLDDILDEISDLEEEEEEAKAEGADYPDTDSIEDAEEALDDFKIDFQALNKTAVSSVYGRKYYHADTDDEDVAAAIDAGYAETYLKKPSLLMDSALTYVKKTSDYKDELEDLQEDYDEAVSDYNEDYIDAEDDYNDTIEDLEEQLADAEEEKQEIIDDYNDTLADLEDTYKEDVSDAEDDYEWESAKDKQTYAYDKQEIEMDADYDYRVRKREMEQEISELEAELAQEITEIKKDYSELSSDFGVTNWLASGGEVGMSPGAIKGQDSVPAMLTPGEFVMNEDTVRKFGANFFRKLNNFRMPRIGFAEGGLVADALSSASTELSSDTISKMLGTVNLQVGKNTYPAKMNLNLAKQMVKEFKTMGLSIGSSN